MFKNLTIIVALIFFACKKKDVVYPINGGPSNVIDKQAKINGFFQTNISIKYINDSIIEKTGGAYVVFFDSLTSTIFGNDTARDIGNVTVNNITLLKFNATFDLIKPYFTYLDSTGTIQGQSKTWKLSGSSHLFPCVFYDNTANPIFSGYSVLPDTISLAYNNIIPIINYSNADEVEVLIENPSSYMYVRKTLPLPVSNITFTSSELLNIAPSTIFSLKLRFYKSTYRNINGKIFQCQTALFIEKPNLIVKY